MKFALTVELDNDAIETGTDLAELLVRIAPTVERCVGLDLADCIGTVRDLNGREVGNWTCIESKMPESQQASTTSGTTHPAVSKIKKVSHWTIVEPKPAPTDNDTKHVTFRDINAHLSDGSHCCYVSIGSERIPIRHARNVEGQLQGRSLFQPGAWITIPPDARVELLD